MRKVSNITVAFLTMMCVTSAFASNNNNNDPVVIKMKGRNVKKSEITKAYSIITKKLGSSVPLNKVYPILLSQIADDYVLEKKATSSGLDKDPQVKALLARAKSQILKATLVKKEVEANVTESAIRKEYEKFKAEFRKSLEKDEKEVHVSHILVKSEDDAKAIIRKLDKGVGFEKLAREKSIDVGSAQNGGDLGYFRKNKMVPSFANVAFSMKKPGEYTKKPVKTQFGYHIIKFHGARKVKTPPLEKVRSFITAQVKAKVMADYMKKLRNEYKVSFYDLNGKNEINPEKEAVPFIRDILDGIKRNGV